MFTSLFRILLIIVTGMAAGACESSRCANCPSDEELLAQTGALRLTPEEVRAYVSDRTEGWVAGGAYYEPGGSLQAIWLKVRYKGSWEVDADGNLCYQLPKWEQRCHFYMRKEDEIFLLDEGKNIGVRPTYQGNRVKDLGRTISTGPRANVN